MLFARRIAGCKDKARPVKFVLDARSHNAHHAFVKIGVKNANGWRRFIAARSADPAGEFKVRVAGLTRSGLTQTSRPMYLALTGVLLPERLELRAIASESGAVRGRQQGQQAGRGGRQIHISKEQHRRIVNQGSEAHALVAKSPAIKSTPTFTA